MNKTELIDEISGRTQLEKTKVAKTVNTFLDVVTEALAKHETVTLIGFGSLKVRRRKARKGVNPQTRKEMTIPATDVPVCSFGESLKLAVAKKKKVKSFVTTPKKKVVAKKKVAAAPAKKAPAKKTTAKKKK
ncbi:MAG TPA: HU family DNA-binding protein [Vampirovibrionales bacterium]